MHVFGAQCYAHVEKDKHNKLDDAGIKYYYPVDLKNYKVYRLLNANDGFIVIPKSVTFAEHPVQKEATRKKSSHLHI